MTDTPMNGAQALIRTLVDAGVDTCFMNPGTSEMHFVAALDSVPDMHSVLALFEVEEHEVFRRAPLGARRIGSSFHLRTASLRRSSGAMLDTPLHFPLDPGPIHR